jgi:hypothetical protein
MFEYVNVCSEFKKLKKIVVTDMYVRTHTHAHRLPFPSRAPLSACHSAAAHARAQPETARVSTSMAMPMLTAAYKLSRSSPQFSTPQPQAVFHLLQ